MGCRPSDVDGLPVFPNLSVVDYTDCLIAACPAGGIEECLIPVARDWESTFSSWAQPPGKTEQQRSENAINAIRNAVDGSPKLRARRIKVFTQSSFRNRVTVRQDSDVDVGAMLYDYFLAQYPEGKVTADFGHHDVDYSFSQFKSELEETLVAHFGRDAVTRGNKTFSIRENTYRVEADVTPFFEFRQYWGNGTYRAGVALVPDNGSQIENFPERLLGYWPSTPLHYENGVSKNDATERRFKGIVRILKEAPHRDGRSRLQRGEVGSRLSAGVHELERPRQCVQPFHMGCAHAGRAASSLEQYQSGCAVQVMA